MQFSIKKLLALRHNKTVQNGAMFSIFSFLNAGISFVLLIIIAGFISPEGYGRINLFTTTVQIFTYLICLNSSGIVSIVFFKDNTESFKRSINTVLAIAIACFLFLSLILLLFNEALEKAIGLDFYFQWIALWICLITVVTQLNLDIFRIEEKVKQYGYYSVILTVLNFVLTLLLVITFKYDWKGRIYAQVISCLVLFAFSCFFLIKNKYITIIKPTKESLKEALSFGVPLIPHSASTWLRQGMDRYFINAFHSTAQVGLFSLSMNFANVITILGTAFNQTNSVYIYKNLSAENTNEVKNKLRKQTFVLTLFFGIVATIVAGGSYLLVPIVFPKYADAVKYIPLLCVSTFFKCIYLQFCNYLFYYKKTLGLMYITFGSALLQVVLSFTLTRYSVFYATVINAFIDFVIALAVFLYSRKFYKVF